MKKKFRNVVIIFLLKFERYRQILNINPNIIEIIVLNMAWKIARVDNIIDKHEEHRIRKISELLHLSHTDFIKAKIKTK